MNSLLLALYRYILYPFAYTAFLGLGFWNQKIAKGLQYRKNKPWVSGPPNCQPIWFHCASGEFEYAKPVIRALKKGNPDLKILVTYFSPSVVSSIEKNSDVDHFTPLPWDFPKAVRSFLDHHNPRCLAIARTDLWPELLHQTQKAQIPIALFSKTMNSEKSFLGTLWYGFCQTYLDRTFVVSEEDRRLLLKVQAPNRIEVAGDTRYDQCLHRLENPILDLPKPESQLPVVIFGSTWPADQSVVLPAIADLISQFHFLIVPHEPTENHIQSIENHFHKSQIATQRFSQSHEFSPETPIIVDKVGVLADLYRWCDFAYVGGSFDRGVHSVMEPLAQGIPCFVGPKNKNNREVQEFATKSLQDGLFPVREIKDSQQLSQALCKFRDQWKPHHKQQLLALFQQKSGGSQKILEWILQAAKL